LPEWLTPVKYVARARVENESVEIPFPEVRR